MASLILSSGNLTAADPSLFGVGDCRFRQALRTGSSFLRPHTPKFAVHCFQIEPLRIELATHPFQHFFVPSMVGVADRLHELRVGPGTATVFWRARPLARHANGILHSLFGRESLLHDQLMNPLIPEVVLVLEPRSAVLDGRTSLNLVSQASSTSSSLAISRSAYSTPPMLKR